ncbi:MAG TPA: threonine-phosphate decarboxylase CobD [Alphaproteobacteria bacterium]|nr:threonine-phosphate decarboxylase CobD [Alphaproteobacteria bacterium]
MAESRVADAPGYHGGNLDAARRLFPGAPEPWLDLSTGINPIPYPTGEIPPEAWTRLPQAEDLAALEDAAREAYGAGPAAGIVAAPGTQAIIQWLPRIFPARRVGILGHTYGEHAECWRAVGAEVVAAQTLADLAGCDGGVVVNPNNPDGRLIGRDELASVARTFAARGGLLVVDEAFMDVMPPGTSLIPALPGGAVVLRSFGKAYGLAGLRLGFAVATGGLGEKLRAAMGPWAVSGPAIAIGRRALTGQGWLTAATARLVEESRRLDHLLTKAGFTVVGGTPLFRLAEREDAAMWFRKLGLAGILTRPFPARPSVLRFGVPSDNRGWARLETALGPTPALF